MLQDVASGTQNPRRLSSLERAAKGTAPGREPTSQEHIELLHAKGLTEAVIAGRGYVSYKAGDLERVCSVAPWVRESQGMRGAVKQSGGMVIPRYGLVRGEWLKELGTLFVYERPNAYIRPDRPVWLGKEAKYLNPPGARLVDVHPYARDAVRSGRQPVFLCLEGCLNADAALSAGLAALSVPGVTLWDCGELTSPSLRRAPSVFVVTDADWETNPNVARQAVACVEHLRSLGAKAVHVAPPPDAADGGKTGLGDHLARGGRIGELVAVPRVPLDPPPWLLERERRVLRTLYARGASIQYVSPRRMAEHLGVDRATVRRALQGLERAKRGMNESCGCGTW